MELLWEVLLQSPQSSNPTLTRPGSVVFPPNDLSNWQYATLARESSQATSSLCYFSRKVDATLVRRQLAEDSRAEIV
jgi:hypothetical protein